MSDDFLDIASATAAIRHECGELDDSVSREFVVASFIIKKFLGILPRDFPKEFPNFGMEDSDQRLLFQFRVGLIAEFLYLLRSVHGFEILIDRFRERDIRSVFYEAQAASLMLAQGFDVEVRREQGRRGEDFDFTANKLLCYLNVEVTEIKNPVFSLNAIRNKLAEKRSQFPDNNAAVLFVYLPLEWEHQIDLKFFLMNETLKFFKKSSRINGVVYSWNRVYRVGTGGACVVCKYSIANSSARHPIDIGFLFGDNPLIQSKILQTVKSKFTRKAIVEHINDENNIQNFNFMGILR